MTRGTFIGAEGTGLKPEDPYGRPMYLPPNTSANAHFLQTLRGLLVQDCDIDDDGEPETLRLLFGTPKSWLSDGSAIRVDQAPTAFGRTSVNVFSALRQGKITAFIEPPKRNPPAKTLIRFRVPDGWRVMAADGDGKHLPVDEKGTVDITSLINHAVVRVRVARAVADKPQKTLICLP
jgi:hypothetical protein